MRYWLAGIFLFCCFATVFLAGYAPVLFDGRQFGYRDGAHFYYPLYQRVQQEWNAGRWPLWEPGENAGVPLLGNPTAAVFYPGKVVFAVLPYAWGLRVYVVLHTALAFGAMLVLMRSWRTTWVGSTLSALSYAFGAPIWFQYSNIIYLVGAAWLPLGFLAVDRWVRLGRRRGLVELALVWTMLTLGGDLQSAYLLGWAAAAYAAGIAWKRGRTARQAAVIERLSAESRDSAVQRVEARRDAASRRSRLWWSIPLVLFSLATWTAATIALASWLPGLRPVGHPPPPLPWMAWIPWGITLAWGLAAIGLLAAWRRCGRRFPLGITWLGLALSAGLAMMLSAIQLLPVIEFTRQTGRAASAAPQDLYPFSIEPFRLVELAWPNILGSRFGGNTYWRDALKLPGAPRETWTPSLYFGGLTLVLACSAMALRQGPPWRVWLSALVLVSLLGSLGQYTSPIWAARAVAEMTHWPLPGALARDLGPLDPVHTTPVRLDGFLRDGDGSVYWWLAIVLPGFSQLRFPAKLFTFTALGLAALAGLGWDHLRNRSTRTRGIIAWFASFLVLTLVVLAGVGIQRSAILSAFGAVDVPSLFGPFEPNRAFRALVLSLVQAAIVLSLGLAILGQVRRRPGWAGAAALVVMTFDLAVANARYVLTVPQSVMEATPEALRIIEEHGRAHPEGGPFRIHRMQAWHPPAWQPTPSHDRVGEIVLWERDTLQPKYGIPLGVEYTHTFGFAELFDYDGLFRGFPRNIRDPEAAKALGVGIGKEILYFPRRSFDMWNTRYFVIPLYPHGWRDEFRGYASFLFQTESIYPDPERIRGPDGPAILKNSREKDYQIRRNLNALPRAWVVHEARWWDPAARVSPDARGRAFQEMMYADDPLWHDATKRAFDPRRVAWVDHDQRMALGPYLSGQPPRPTETVQVTYPTPQSAELEVSLESPGLVILADVVYPGWELTIDGRPASIYSVNWLMRGAAVPAGPHRLVYTYAPRSFRIGRVISIVGLAVLALAAVGCAKRPFEPVLGLSEARGRP
jgi:hypothetical protein